MDVGDPSNLSRIIDLFQNDHSLIQDVIYSRSYSDDETLREMDIINESYNYIIDPHGAVGCSALNQFYNDFGDKFNGVVLETAHPSKFIDVFKNNLSIKPDMPERLAKSLDKEGHSISMSKLYKDFKEYLVT